MISPYDAKEEVPDLASVCATGIAGRMPKVVRGDGAYLQTADGRRIIDAISFWSVETHGHCHPHIVSAIRSGQTSSTRSYCQLHP